MDNCTTLSVFPLQYCKENTWHYRKSTYGLLRNIIYLLLRRRFLCEFFGQGNQTQPNTIHNKVKKADLTWSNATEANPQVPGFPSP